MIRAYSEYSIGYGGMDLKAYVTACKDAGYTYAGLTERRFLHSAPSFLKACKEAEVKPIIGLDLPTSHPLILESRGNVYTTFVALNTTGLKKLFQLSTLANQKNVEELDLRDPRIEAEIGGWEGLALLPSGDALYSVLGRLINQGSFAAAEEEAQFWLPRLPIYLEAQFRYDPDTEAGEEESSVNKDIQEFADLFGLSVLLTNPTRMVAPDDLKRLATMIAVIKKLPRDSVLRILESEGHLYMRRPEEYQPFVPRNHAVTLWQMNNQLFADSVQSYEFGKEKYFPHAPIPEGMTEQQYFVQMVKEGFDERVKQLCLLPEEEKRYRDQLNFEFPVIKKTGYIGYLIVMGEIIKAEREEVRKLDLAKYGVSLGNAIGPGRGSGAGSLTLFSQGITDIDSMRYELMFERFLNVERVSDPDIDTDFLPDRRDAVTQKCRDIYGEKNVSGIISYSTFGAKSGLHDVARILGISADLAEAMTKVIPNTPGITLKDALETSEELQKILEANTDARILFDEAKLIEGAIRNTGVHAAGRIIASVPIDTVAPMMWDEENGWMVQWDKDDAEAAGLMKMDFLGLTTMAIVRRVLAEIYRLTGEVIDLSKIPMDDPATLDLYRRGETDSVFQFESPGMKRMLQEFHPDSIDDLILLNAAYRPGPLQYIPSVIEAKKSGKTPVELEIFRPILAATYGKPIYQEQVMQMFQAVGYTLGEADIIRRAMAKKKEKELVKQKERFLSACKKEGMPEERLEPFWAEVMAFAEYGFNKSHAAAYAVLSYQTAYLKVHYPEAFFAAAIAEENNKDAIEALYTECRKRGVKLLPPHINESQVDPYVAEADGVKAVRLGFSQIKGVNAAAEKIVEERNARGPFDPGHWWDLFIRLRSNVNVTALTGLAKAGALDQYGERGALLASILRYKDEKMGDKLARRIKSNKVATWEGPPIEAMTPLSKEALRKHEKDVLRYEFSPHPIVDVRRQYLHRHHDKRLETIAQMEERISVGEKVWIEAVVQVKKIKIMKRRSDGADMGRITVEDEAGTLELTAFVKEYAPIRDGHVEPGDYLKIAAFLGENNGKYEWYFRSFDRVDAEYQWRLALPETQESRTEEVPEEMKMAYAIMKDHPGNTPVYTWDTFSYSFVLTHHVDPACLEELLKLEKKNVFGVRVEYLKGQSA